MQFVIFLMLLFTWTPVRAEPQVLDVSRELEGQYLGRLMTICVGSLDAPDCVQGQQDIPNRFLGRGDFWLRVRVQNPGTEPVSGIIEHPWPSDYLRIIHKAGDVVLADEEFGNLVFKRHAIEHRHAAKKLIFPPGSSELLMHMQHVGALRIPIRIWSEDRFQHGNFEGNIAAGILVGVTLAMVFYNIFLFVTLRIT